MWTETIELKKKKRHKKVHLYTIFNYGLFLTQVYSRASEDHLFYFFIFHHCLNHSLIPLYEKKHMELYKISSRVSRTKDKQDF